MEKSPLVPVLAFGVGILALYQLGSMLEARSAAAVEVARARQKEVRREARAARRRKWKYGY